MFNDEDWINRNFPGGFTVRDEANALTALCFRNGPIENLHAGKYSELLENPSYSRITDGEMKKLMISASSQLAGLLLLKETEPEKYWEYIKHSAQIYTQGWER